METLWTYRFDRTAPDPQLFKNNFIRKMELQFICSRGSYSAASSQVNPQQHDPI